MLAYIFGLADYTLRVWHIAYAQHGRHIWSSCCDRTVFAANNDDELDADTYIYTYVCWKYWIITRLAIVRNSQCRSGWCLFAVLFGICVYCLAFGVGTSIRVRNKHAPLQYVCAPASAIWPIACFPCVASQLYHPVRFHQTIFRSGGLRCHRRVVNMSHSGTDCCCLTTPQSPSTMRHEPCFHILAHIHTYIR